MGNNFNFLIYKSVEEDVFVDALIKDESIWLTQKSMAELFDVNKSTISRHLKNIFEEGELNEKVVVAKIATTTQHGAIEGKTQNKDIQFYNLDVIISVGYRINSRRATNFRIWATSILKEYMIKGFAMDDERLKQGKNAFGKDYFRELLERVRSIRASERRIWLQITDIFAECSIDYDKNSPVTKEFYAMVQNKFHYAITGKTVAEIIYMEEFSESINEFLNFRRYKILKDKGSISKKAADEKAVKEYEIFNKTQPIISDFDIQIKKLLEKDGK